MELKMEIQSSKILRLPKVMEMTGLSRSTIYAYMGKNLFPKAVQLGPRAVGWMLSDIEGWVAQRAVS
jgi:prophage regulatory protein